jgi:predicted aspartyl protease
LPRRYGRPFDPAITKIYVTISSTSVGVRAGRKRPFVHLGAHIMIFPSNITTAAIVLRLRNSKLGRDRMALIDRAALTETAPVMVAFLVVSALASGLTPGPARAGAVGNSGRSTVIADINEDQLVVLLDRSDAGDIHGLREARASISDAGLHAVVDVRLAASRLDLPATKAAMRDVARLPVSNRLRGIALAVEAEAAFACGDFGLAAKDSVAWMALPLKTDPIHKASDVEQMRDVAEQLDRLPRQSLKKHLGSAHTWRDKATLLRTNVVIDGRLQAAVLDTGANVSVITVSTAHRLGLMVVGGASVRGANRDAVPVRLAVARRLEIASSTFRNVAFLVMDDADLRLPLPGGYSIPTIIGFPVLRALGRVTFTSAAIATTGTGQSRGGALIVATGSDLFVAARVKDFEVPLHIDTGASSTTLGPRFADEHPALVGSLGHRIVKSAGAGGAKEETVSVLKDAKVSLGSFATHLASIDVAPAESGGGGNYGALGQDVLKSAKAYTIDFDAMKLDAVPSR